jgi:hypothetical protein
MMQRRFIDMAIGACERHADHDEPHAFKWVVETVAPLLYWLEHSPDRQIERFCALEKAGRIEVGGAFLNASPLADAADHAEMLQPVARLRRDYGFTITHLQNADVNGPQLAAGGPAGTFRDLSGPLDGFRQVPTGPDQPPAPADPLYNSEGWSQPPPFRIPELRAHCYLTIGSTPPGLP